MSEPDSTLRIQIQAQADSTLQNQTHEEKNKSLAKVKEEIGFMCLILECRLGPRTWDSPEGALDIAVERKTVDGKALLPVTYGPNRIMISERESQCEVGWNAGWNAG